MSENLKKIVDREGRGGTKSCSPVDIRSLGGPMATAHQKRCHTRPGNKAGRLVEGNLASKISCGKECAAYQFAQTTSRGAGAGLARSLAASSPVNGALCGAGVFTANAWSEIARSLKLSPRELDVVQGVFEDQTEETIASTLDISPHTVHSYLNRLYRKLGVRTRPRLVLHVMLEVLPFTVCLNQSLRPG